MDQEDTELRNPFPSPPSHYTKYTSHNLNLLSLLRERVAELTPDVNQHEVLFDQQDVPDWPLIQLEKPRVDWILEEQDAHYDVFGDRWFVKEKIPSLGELGGTQLYPQDPSVDRRPALLSVLRSLLVTFSSLTGSLLAPPPNTFANTPPDWQRHVEWITILSQNIMAAANDLRPVQARGNLEGMMRRQLQLRQKETEEIHSKCDSMEAKLTELRQKLQDITPKAQPTRTNLDPPFDTKNFAMNVDSVQVGSFSSPPNTQPGGLTQKDVLRWAEEVGCEHY